MVKNDITAIVIAKNEEQMIADCLDSLKFCGQIIVVDNGSEDNTSDIAKRMGAEVIKLESNNFSTLREEGLKNSQKEWIFYIDADERVTAELQMHIQEVVLKDSGTAAYKIWRKNFYFGNHEWPFIESLERLFRKDHLEGWHGQVHETPRVKGSIGQLDGFLLHYTHRDLTSMLEKTIEWSKIEAELRFKAGHPPMAWWRFPRVMLTAFFDSYVRQQGWRIGTAGLIESIFQSFSMFITYARLWEMQNKVKSQNEKAKNTS